MPQRIWNQNDLEKLVRHKKPEVRKWACERMNTLFGESGIGILGTLLKDKDEKVLHEAFKYLEEYPQGKFIPDLLKIYQTQQGVIAGRSAFILAKLKYPELIEVFKKKSLLRPIEEDELFLLVKAMGELAIPQAKEILRDTLSKVNEKTEPYFIQNLIHALLMAKEDNKVILNFYANFYPRFSIEILQPFVILCGSWVSLVDIKQEETRPKKIFKNKIPPVLDYTINYLKRKGCSSLAQVIPVTLAKKNYSFLIQLIWQQVEETLHKKLKGGHKFIEEGDYPFQKSFQFLKSFRDYISWGPKESFRDISIVALLILEKFLEFDNLIGLQWENLAKEELFGVLFEDRSSLDIDDQLIEKLLAQVSAEMIFNKAIEQLEKDPYSAGTERALRMLGRLREKKAVPFLVNFLKKRAEDFALNACLWALEQIGQPFLEYIVDHYDQLDEKQKMEILFALRNIPEEETADFLLRHWDDLWKIDKEIFLGTLEGVASKRFIGFLRQELREGESFEEDTFYLLCQIHGVSDSLLSKIEKSKRAREKEIEKYLSILNSGDLTPFLKRPIKIELKCRQCNKSYFYEVEDIYLDEKDGHPIFENKIVCKNCLAINQYELTSNAYIPIIGQMILLEALADKGKLNIEDSPVKIVSTSLMDGQKMSREQIINYYKKEIKKSPQDPALRIGYGSVLIRVGREEEAISQYEEALRLDPKAVEAYATLGDYAGDKGNFALAYEYFKKAYNCLPNGHYYRTKDLDALKKTIIINLEHYRQLWEGKIKETYHFSSPGIVKQEKIGRNAPCPCGSGKKYKKCCLQKMN